MDLMNKYIIIHVPASEGIPCITGCPANDAEGFVVIAGYVRGEAPVGLWVDIDEVIKPSGDRVSAGEHKPDGPTFFVRWDYVRYARVYLVEKPEAAIAHRPGFL
jgi:hypothetical protein